MTCAAMMTIVKSELVPSIILLGERLILGRAT
jgi:hypothetical protein